MRCNPLSVRPRRLLRSFPLLLCAALAASCGGGDEAEARALPATARAPRDARLVEAQVAFERGEPEVARTLLEAAVDVDPVDRAVLEARLAIAAGDPTGALRALNQAKQRWPADPRVYACEAELFAVMGRLAGAEESIAQGLERAGNAAELERARAVVALSIPGGAELGMQHLRRALELDPNVPYARHALAQAHLLVGRMDLARDEPQRALEHAAAALGWDATAVEYRELEAEALVALLRYEDALERYAELEAVGVPVRAERARLHQQLATARLLGKDRDGALEHYLAARALGLSDEELGFGVNALAEAAGEAVERGVDHYDEGRLGEARAAFERALELNPDDLGARSHLGVVLFRQAAYEEAARAWAIVVDDAERQGVELPEPVHLNLARARYLADDLAGARAVCERYLDAHPEGTFVEDTRDLLAELELVALQRER